MAAFFFWLGVASAGVVAGFAPEEQLAQASPDLLRAMVTTFAQVAPRRHQAVARHRHYQRRRLRGY